MIRAIVVDDEPLAIRALVRLLAAEDGVEIAGTAETLEGAADLIAAQRPDVVFLDIDLGVGTGFDLITALSPLPKIVFVTGSPHHAVAAFAVDAVDYLLKPVPPQRLQESLRRVARSLPGQPDDAPAPLTIELRTPNRTVLADTATIAAFQAEGDFTRVHLADQPAMLILRTLSNFEIALPDVGFLRVSRSLILNLDRVRKVESWSRDATLVTLDGVAAPLTLGRTAATRLRQALAQRGRDGTPPNR